MYAIFDNGNKQYKVSVGDTVKVEKLNAEVGATVTFPVVLAADEKNVQIGKEVEKLHVTAEVLAHGKDKKIIVFKYKAKKNERKKQGHRQPYTTIKVTAIGALEAKAKTKAVKTEEKAENKTENKTEVTAPVAEIKVSKAKAPKAEGETKAAATKTATKTATKKTTAKATAEKPAENKAE